jgi:hypothetical protein
MANVTIINELITPAPPALPLGLTQYSRQYQDDYSRVLRLYFQQLSGVLQTYLSDAGGRFVSLPCGSFFSNASTNLTSNVVTVVTLNNTDANATVATTLSNGSVQVTYAGVYNYQFSAQFENSGSQAHDVDFWVRVDGNNVYESATQLTIPSKHGNRNGAAVAALNIFVTAEANSVIDFVCAASHPDIRLAALPASSSPFDRPSIPSLISTITFVSRLST